MRLMTRIEAIPLHTMELGLRWDWVTFPQWLDSLASHPLGVNVGALVPFNALRLYVMGVEASRTRVRGTEKEIAQMQAILHEAMQAGAFGWSAMKTLANRPDDGRFIPSQVASNEEFLALAEVLAEFGVGHIGWTRGAAERPLPPGEPDLIGGGDPGPAVAAVTGASALLMEAVEDAPGRGREDFLIQMCLASGRPCSGAPSALTSTHPCAIRNSSPSWNGRMPKGHSCMRRRARCRPRPCSSSRSITGLMPCPTGSIRSWGLPKSGWRNCNGPGCETS